jgi:demethylmenaquinone methyltransferase/2-methoxy-6-polyprenyl-1,4-benzoquinol methylase
MRGFFIEKRYVRALDDKIVILTLHKMPSNKPSSTEDIYNPAYVKQVFDKCSSKYILFSFICSFGFTEIWRKQAVKNMPEPLAKNLVGYDLMAGTGEVWPHLLKRFSNISSIVAIDISSGMHNLALERLHKHRKHKINFIQDDVLQSNLSEKSCDFLISTFGLKTFNASQHRKLAGLVAKSLKPGGVFSFIEASDPKGWIFRPLYLFHLRRILPLIERLFLRGAQDFSMIGQYSTNFGNAEDFANLLEREGLDVEFRSYFFGCATGVIGRKPI